MAWFEKDQGSRHGLVEDKAEQEEVDFVYSVSKLVFIEHLRIGLEQARQSFAVLVKKFRDALALRGPLERFVCELRFVDSRHYAIALDSKLMILIKRPTPRFGLTPNTLRNLYYGRLMQMLRAEGRRSEGGKIAGDLQRHLGSPDGRRLPVAGAGIDPVWHCHLELRRTGRDLPVCSQHQNLTIGY
jgi:hypothetical protein